jgi:hypothetical protein
MADNEQPKADAEAPVVEKQRPTKKAKQPAKNAKKKAKSAKAPRKPNKAYPSVPLEKALQIAYKIKEKNGSSPNSGERGPDLEEEVGVVAEAIGHSLDDLDLVVDALDQVGAERPAAVGQDA